MAQAPVTIRPARAAYMAAIGEIVAGSWWRTFSGLLPQDVLVSITPEAQKSRHERGFAREDLHYRVACGNGEVVGFASWGPARDPGFAVFCELYALYLRPGWERQGIGRRLFGRVVSDVAASGGSGLGLTALALNPNLGFYAALGGIEAAAPDIRLGGGSYRQVAFLWPSLRPAR